MPTRLCIGDPTCPNPATYRGRCAAHAAANERLINRAGYDIYRTKRWQMTRRAYLFEHPLCEHEGCETIATDVHHRIDLAAGGDPWAPENLQALCHPHHSQATRAGQANPMSDGR